MERTRRLRFTSYWTCIGAGALMVAVGLDPESVKKTLAILLLVELLLTAALFSDMEYVRRVAVARTSSEWKQHPSPETRQAFE